MCSPCVVANLHPWTVCSVNQMCLKNVGKTGRVRIRFYSFFFCHSCLLTGHVANWILLLLMLFPGGGSWWGLNIWDWGTIEDSWARVVSSKLWPSVLQQPPLLQTQRPSGAPTQKSGACEQLGNPSREVSFWGCSTVEGICRFCMR